MRYLYTILILLFYYSNAFAQYVVENKCGKQSTGYTVVNKCQTPVKQIPVKASTTTHNDHNCPNCGTLQTTVYRQQGQMHSHKCGKCGTEWWHGNPGVSMQSTPQYTPQYSIGSPVSGGCANGSCAIPSSQRFGRGLFGRVFGR